MCSRAGRFDKRNYTGMAIVVALVKPKIGDMDYLFCLCDAVERRAIPHASYRIAPKPIRIIGFAVNGDRSKIVPLSQEQIAKFGLADARGILQHSVKHRL